MNSAITNLVLREGGCFRCALRLSGEVSMSIYQSVQDNSCNCPFCLGILSPDRFTSLALSSIESCKYEFSDYKFQVTLPPVIYLRNEWLLGKFKLENVHLTRIVEIKDVFKWAFSPLIGSFIQKPFSIDSDFRVNLNFECNDETEVDEFFAEFGGKKKESMFTVFKSVNSERITSKYKSFKNIEAGLKVECSYAPIYITGNYLKLERGISQTPWSVDGDNEVKDSVQDIIGRVVNEHYSSSNCILHSSVRFK